MFRVRTSILFFNCKILGVGDITFLFQFVRRNDGISPTFFVTHLTVGDERFLIRSTSTFSFPHGAGDVIKLLMGFPNVAKRYSPHRTPVNTSSANSF